mmetsp:Transcript_38257/g.86070  ORF Transcript_38257/g.86070 Transcript_38257/m.86070 type:complete len:418 (+) Transcript_38257:175-1428(+)
MQTKLWSVVWLCSARKVAAQAGEPGDESITISPETGETATSATAEPNMFAIDAAIQADVDESTAAATNSTVPATQATSSTTTPWDTSGLPIYQMVKKTKDLWLLSAAIQAALVDTALTEYGPFTLFAPVDDALFALPSGMYSKLTTEPLWMPQLQDFLLYHVLGSEVSIADLSGNMTTVETINFQSDKITVNLTDFNLDRSDIGCSNGVVHMVQSAFFPPSVTNTVMDILSARPDLDTFVGVLNTAGLVDFLSGEGPYTVFVPTNRALAALPEGAIDERYLEIFVKHHVLSDNAISTSLETGDVTALSNFSVALTIEETDDGRRNMMIDNANILAWDFIANNGVLHIIDEVLMPPLPIEEEVEEEVDVFVEDPDDATGPSEKPASQTEKAAQSQPSSALSRAASMALGIIVSNTIIR